MVEKFKSRICVVNKKTGQKSFKRILLYLNLKNITDYKITVDFNKEKRNRRLRSIRLRNETEVS
jgi:hypothetical protein